MYNSFFGFRENPFRLVPDPAYLFLSKSHEEALAYLNYAISQGDGFVEITGEVGTGKTTLCRAFLNGLDASVAAAYIFNPKLEPKDLLKSINDELGIEYDADNTKHLIDRLNAFLLRKKAERKTVIVVIDEAQNLSREVLEQLRLLSNLETSKEKLLQIILIGQPELSKMLDSYDLRQVSQRINLRYQILPLSFNETREYIQYRLSVASPKRSVTYSRAAFLRIYNYSRGIPRIINIACHRTLLSAFCLNQHKITGQIAKMSIRELTSRGGMRRFALQPKRMALLMVPVLVILLVLFVWYKPQLLQHFSNKETSQSHSLAALAPADGRSAPATSRIESRPASGAQEREAPSSTADATAQIKPPDRTEQPSSLAGYLERMDPKTSRQAALRHLLSLWGMDARTLPQLENLDDQTFFRLAAISSGLYVYRFKGDINLLQNLNIPVIMEFHRPGGELSGYLALSAIDGNKILFGGTDNNSVIEANVNEMSGYWSGVAYVPWKNYLPIWGTLPGSRDEDSVVALKLLLHDLGFSNLQMNATYDDRTRNAVEQIQAKHGMPVDGVVGPLTKIVLYREKNAYPMPQLGRGATAQRADSVEVNAGEKH